MEDEGVVYIAIDVKPTRFGEVLGELNRAGWTITGSEELDEERCTFSSAAPARDVGWYRLYGERKLGNEPLRLGF